MVQLLSILWLLSCTPASANFPHDLIDRLGYTALANRWGQVLDGYGYLHDSLGLRTNITRDFGLATSTVSAGYDAIGQLTSWSASEGSNALRLSEQLGWAYDAAHNLRYRTNNALLQTFSTDLLNQPANAAQTTPLTVSGATPAPAARTYFPAWATSTA